MIGIENLTKPYRTLTGRHYVFKSLNIIFPKGHNIAPIGRDGVGKSTLLRIIGSTDRPDNGNTIIKHKISWPAGLAGEFQGSLTGRESVRFVARLYVRCDGLNERVDFVEEFFESGEYFDMSIKTYSSGTRPRLVFRLSMAFKFSRYLTDEITAVGDIKFKEKCSDIFGKVREKSHLVMVSYSK